MADNIRIKRTSVADVKPTTDQILDGELVLNLKDGILFTRLLDSDSDPIIGRVNISKKVDGVTVKNKAGETEFTI